MSALRRWWELSPEVTRNLSRNNSMRSLLSVSSKSLQKLLVRRDHYYCLHNNHYFSCHFVWLQNYVIRTWLIDRSIVYTHTPSVYCLYAFVWQIVDMFVVRSFLWYINITYPGYLSINILLFHWKCLRQHLWSITGRFSFISLDQATLCFVIAEKLDDLRGDLLPTIQVDNSFLAHMMKNAVISKKEKNEILSVRIHFYRVTRMHSANCAVARRLSVSPSVCLSVRPSVTRRYWV